MRRALAGLVLCAVLAAGCGQTIEAVSGSSSGTDSSFPGTSSAEASSKPEETKQYTYDMGCAFYVFHENNIKGVLTNGKVIQVSKECYDNLQYGNCCQSVTIQINKNGTEKIIRVSELFYNFDDAVKGNREDAPGEFVEENLKWGMRDGSRHSITAYEINEIQVEPGVGFDPIVFTVKYSITPARYATGFKAYHQYLPDRDGPVPAITGLTQRIILLYIDKRWIPYSDNAGLYFSCFDEIPTPNLNEAEYQDESAGYLRRNTILIVMRGFTIKKKTTAGLNSIHSR